MDRVNESNFSAVLRRLHCQHNLPSLQTARMPISVAHEEKQALARMQLHFMSGTVL